MFQIATHRPPTIIVLIEQLAYRCAFVISAS
jgi:hypothetical protein